MPRIQKAVHRDFTVVHNGFLKGCQLSLQARGLLVTMMSKPEFTSDGTPWNFTIRGLASELKEGKAAIASTLNDLEERGYLMRDTITDEKGRFVDILYTFSDEIMPEAIEKYRRKHPEKYPEYSSAPSPDNPCTENRDTDIRNPENPDTENTDNNKIKKNKIPKKKILSDEVTINQSANPQSFQQSGRCSIDEIERLQALKEKREETECYIKQNIEYYWYESFFADIEDNSSQRGKITYAATMSEIDMILEIIVNAICTEKETIRIGKEDKCQSVVESRYKKLEMKHIEYALKCLMLNTKNIKNPISYLQTVLYNASFTCDFAESNELKNIDPALFIPEQFHNEEFKEKHYEHTAFRSIKHNDW